MKVCMVGLEILPIPPVKGGAVEKLVLEGARSLAKKGIETHVISIADEQISEKILRDNNSICFHYIKIPSILRKYPIDQIAKGLYFFSQAGKIIKKINPDIAHYQNYPFALYLASRKYYGKVANVLSFHNMDYGWNFVAKRADRFGFALGLKKADMLFTCSNFIKNFVESKYGRFVNDRIFTIYNAVNTGIFNTQTDIDKKHIRESLSLNENDKVLIFVGRIDQRKGVRTLIGAFNKVKESISNLKLIIIGPKGSFWHKNTQSYALGIQEMIQDKPDVILLPPVYNDRELSKLYGIADVGCVPSVFPEGLGNVSLEMQACGIPVVCSDIGGLPETLITGETGFLAKSGDEVDLANKIIEILQDPIKARQMGEAARALIENKYSWDTVSGSLIEKYAECVSRKGKNG